MNRTDRSYDDPGLEGPDYVALVIEWDGIADALEDEITTRNEAPRLARKPHTWQPAFAVLGVIGVLLLARWTIHHLRAA